MNETNERQQEQIQAQPELQQVQIVQPGKKQSIFINLQETKKIDLGNNNYVEVLKEIPWKIEMIFSDEKLTQEEKMETLLLKCIVSWNLVDNNGEIAAINKDTISLLDSGVITKIITGLKEGKEEIPKADASAS